ncbi:MAG: PAS domain S-box protein [Deltaproteobacteria bacterium]|nr:PAS domain S-box protein [Deltaproteobacteria bacterium]
MTQLRASRASGEAAAATAGVALFRTLADTTAAAIWIFRDSRVFYVNPAAEEMCGYRAEEMLTMDGWLLVPEPERAYARAVAAARLRGERVPARREQRLLTKEGEIRWVDYSAAVILWDGEPAILGTAFDVTERRRAAREHLDRERRFRGLIEHSSDLVSIVSPDALLTYTSPSIERVLGYHPEQWMGRSIYDLVHTEDHELCRSALVQLASGPGVTVRVQYRLSHADGSWHWMEGIACNLVHEPAIGGIIVNARDVTEQRRAEDRLRESEARFALAVDGAKDGIWDWDLVSDQFFASPRMREILDLDADTPVSVLTVFGNNLHPDDYQRMQEGWQAHLQGDATHYEAEYRFRRRDDTYMWLLARARSVRDPGGVPRRMVGSLTDLTERKRAEEAARQRQAELAHVLRVSAMDEMAAGIAHELNQPLAAIVNYARGCARRLDDAPPDVLEALDRIAAEALRAGDIVHGLKRVVRKEPPRESAVDLKAVAREAVQLVRPEATERGISLRLDLHPDLPEPLGDRIQIEQVILNLLRNAIEAIALRPGLVALRILPHDQGGVRVAVSDTGGGIPAALRDRIFAPFFTTKTSGLGMGLSISRTIVEAHGGRLWAEPNPGAGTTFLFTLPYRKA